MSQHTITRQDFQSAIEDGITTLKADTPGDYARLAARLRRVGREATSFTHSDFGPLLTSNTYDADRCGCPLTKAGTDGRGAVHALGYSGGFFGQFDRNVRLTLGGWPTGLRSGSTILVVG